MIREAQSRPLQVAWPLAGHSPASGFAWRPAIACIALVAGWAWSASPAAGPEARAPREPGLREQSAAQAAVTADVASSLRAVTLEELVRRGAARNPKLQAARSRWRAAIEKYPQVTALPDPMLMYGRFGENVETRVGPQEYRVEVSQAFPFPGTLKAAGQVALREVAIQRIRYDQAVRDFIVDLKLSFHELAYLEGAAEITRQNQLLLDHILKLANTRYAQGQAKLNDILKAQSQVAQLTYDLILLRELREVERAKVNALLDMPTTTPLGPVKIPPLSLVDLSPEQAEQAALARRQELLTAEEQIRKTEEAVELARLRTLPKFNLSAVTIGTGQAEANVPDSGKDPWMIGIGVSLPLWRSKNRSHIREAELKREVAVHGQRALENQTRAQVKAVYFRLENARRLIDLYEKSLIPQAEQAMEVAEAWQANRGAKDVSAFLETQSVWLNFNLARLRAVTDYQQYLARLERLMGGRFSSNPERQEEAQ